MTTRDKYTEIPDPYSMEIPSVGDARFTWEYDDGKDECRRNPERTQNPQPRPGDDARELEHDERDGEKTAEPNAKAVV